MTEWHTMEMECILHNKHKKAIIPKAYHKATLYENPPAYQDFKWNNPKSAEHIFN